MTDGPSLLPFDLRSFVELRGWGDRPGSPSAALSAVSSRVARRFAIGSPFAPGLRCIGAEVALDPAAAAANGSPWLSATGNGESAEVAVASCLGEATDLISQFKHDGDVTACGRPAETEHSVVGGWIASIIGPADGATDWMPARKALSGGASLIWADLCIRREPSLRMLLSPGALSSGAAAGPSLEAAALRAVLELCERDALALWWLGDRGARSLAAGHAAHDAGHDLLARLRQGVAARQTSLLDIGGDLGVPATAAISTDRDGRGLACGAAARLDWGEAARAAVLELRQMELSAPVAAIKRAERGEDALNGADRRHLRRAAFDASGCERLVPVGPAEGGGGSLAAGGLDGVLRLLKQGGIAVHLLDLTRPDVGIPVVRAVAPGLQPFAAGARRLARPRPVPPRQSPGWRR